MAHPGLDTRSLHETVEISADDKSTILTTFSQLVELGCIPEE